MLYVIWTGRHIRDDICYMNCETYKIWYMLNELCYMHCVVSDMIYVIWTVRHIRYDLC